MGLGALLTRNTKWTAEDTVTGASHSWEVITDGTPGMLASWGKTGPYQGGMSIPGAYRAAVLLSDLAGSVPWHAFRDVAGQPPIRIEPTPTVLDEPVPGIPAITAYSSWALDLIWDGNAIGLVAARNRQGTPTAYSMHAADSVLTKRANPGEFDGISSGTQVYYIAGQWYGPDDVLHVRGLCKPGALRGLGALECHLDHGLNLAAALGEQAAGVAEHAVPSMLLRSLDPDFDETDAVNLKASVKRAVRVREPLVLNAVTEAEPVSWNPTETQLIEARRLSLLELALIFGIDPSWIGASQSSRVYTNIEQEGINLLKFSSLNGIVRRFEGYLSLKFPRGVRVRPNLDFVLQADTLTRYQAHAAAITAGFMAPSEARAFEHWAPFTPEQQAELEALKPKPPEPPAGAGAGPAKKTPTDQEK